MQDGEKKPARRQPHKAQRATAAPYAPHKQSNAPRQASLGECSALVRFFTLRRGRFHREGGDPRVARAGARAVMDEECLEDFAGVFSLIDRDGTGQIPEAALVQALQGSGFMDQAAATAMAEEQAGPIDLNVFRECVVQAVEAASRRSLEMMTSKRGGALTGLPTLGAALLGILDDLKKYAQAVKDFRLAHNAKEMSDSLKAREEMRRMREISQRQESDQHGVQEAHMMQACS